MTIASPYFDIDADNKGTHIESNLIDMAVGTWQPTSPEMDNLVDHLMGCLYCQVTLGVLLATQQNADKSENDAQRKALLLLAGAIREMQIQDDICPYIDVLEAVGVEEANKQFPILASHLKRCKACRSEVEEIRLLLGRAKNTRGTTPLSTDNHSVKH